MKKIIWLFLLVFFVNSFLYSLIFAKKKEIFYSDDLFFNIYAYNKIFSPNNDGLFDELILEFVLLKNKKDIKVKKWNLNIINEQTKEIVFSVDGEKNIPEKITWNGYLSGGSVKEGNYGYEFTASINKKNILLKEDDILIDITAPFISLNSSSNIAILSGGNRFIKPIIFYLNVGDETEIDTSKSKLQIINYNNKVVKEWFFQTYKDIPSNIVWDGKDDIYSRLVPEGEYEVVLTAYDIVSNKEEITRKLTVLKSIKGNIEDIKVKEEPVLEVILPNKIFFDINSFDLNEDAQKTLQDITIFLKSYPTDKIFVEGYMDFSEKSISDEKISLDRAKKVFDFLVKNDIAEDRLTIVDCGNMESVEEDNGVANAANNRRVSIVISTDIVD